MLGESGVGKKDGRGEGEPKPRSRDFIPSKQISSKIF